MPPSLPLSIPATGLGYLLGFSSVTAEKMLKRTKKREKDRKPKFSMWDDDSYLTLFPPSAGGIICLNLPILLRKIFIKTLKMITR